MQVRSLLLLRTLFCCCALLGLAGGQLMLDPPKNTTTALGTNATFSCRGNGQVVWDISNTQVRTADVVQSFADVEVYVPLPTPNFSELVVKGTLENNFTRPIRCVVDPENVLDPNEESDAVNLLVYAQPFPPSDPVVEVDRLNLVVTWTEPFSLQGEEIYYVVSITNVATRENRELDVNTTSYVLSEPFGDQRNCEEYEFSIFSRNGFSKSMSGISARQFIPTVPLVTRQSDVSIDVSLNSGVRATVNFNPRDPCSTYPVTLYNFTVVERGTTDMPVSIQHSSNVALILDNANAGLLPDRVYSLYIDAVNSVGSTPSEEILLYTTGLQSVRAVMELDGSITVTCTFATGASSTGCLVTIFTTDNSQMEIFSKNITRQNGDTEVTDNMAVLGLPQDSMLVVQTAELLSGGGVSNVLFERTVTVATVTTAPTTTTPSSVTSSTVEGTSEPSTFNSTFYFIVGAVLGSIVVLLLLIILSVCVIVSLRRKRKNKYPANDDELKNNYCYGGTITHAQSHVPEPSILEGGVHARSNTYDQSNNFALGEDIQVGPVYETITDKLRMGNGASARPVPNPVYGGEVVHSGSKLAENPVYAEAGEAQGSASRGRGPTLLSQVSTATDVSALNPVYSGVAVPISPHSDSSVFSMSQPHTPSVVPQPSPGGAGAKSGISSGGASYDTKLYSSPYATPNQSNDRYATVPTNPQTLIFPVPQVSPTHSGGGEDKPFYSNAPARMVPTNPDTGYSTLTREEVLEPPPGPLPLYETIKVKDTRPPVRPDGDGVTLQTNTSYGLLLSDSQSPPSSSPSHTPMPTPGSPTPAPPHSPPPKERAPPVPNDSESQTSQL